MKICPRLEMVASCVNEGEYIIDVGTDHAYIPIFLCKYGKIQNAVASDIREGPLKIANNNIKRFGLEDKISTLLCPGLEKAYLYPQISCAVIAGMGGDMIVNILDNNKETAQKINLVLQPMTHYAQLRKYLYDNGYEISTEKLAKEDRRVYQVICAKYTGKVDTYEDYELYLSKKLLEKKDDPLFEDHRNFILNKLKIIYNGNKDENLFALITRIENA